MECIKKEIGELEYIMEDWKECTIQEVTTYKKGFAFKLDDYKNSGIRIVKVSNLNQDLYDETKYVYLDPSEFNKYEDVSLKYFDIVISTVGSWPNNPNSVVGKVTKIPRYLEGSLLNQNAVIFRANKFVRQDFLYYLLKDEKFFNYITGTAQGSASQASIKLVDIMNFSFNLPPLPTQQKIAQILSSLDDKIELNNKINANLEQQAQALFKSWFVDFEPFGGEMPAGWKVGKLSEIANYSSDKISISELNNDTYYSTENMLPNKAGVEAASTIPNVIQTTRCFPGETIISNIRPYFKKIYYCTEKKAGCSTDVLCFKPIAEKYSEYLYQILYSDKFFDYMVLGSKGTKMPRGDKQQIMNYEIVIPNDEYTFRFASISKQILRKIDSNRKENKKLSSIRDILLPKLMSRELEID